jgi:hypothetical protein
MTFSKKVKNESTGSGSASSEDWNVYNEAIWNTFDVVPTKDAKGREVKTGNVIGVLNFIMELGNQPLAPASMKSNFPAPSGDDKNSPEELARLVDYPNNWFDWDTEYKNGVATKIRKVYWNQDPQETLVLAVDFPELQMDYSLHPSSENESADIKPLRIDYNGKFKGVMERNVSNEVLWKTGKFGEKDVKYKIATACGILEAYQNDEHDIGHLVQATCNWKVVMTKNVDGEKVYYNVKITDPSAIQDIKMRNDVYTVAQQIEDLRGIPEFTGVFFDGDDDHYSAEQLQQVRGFWWDEAKKAIEFDKNKGTARESSGTWLKGMDYANSGLARAAKKFNVGGDAPKAGDDKPQTTPKNDPVVTPKVTTGTKDEIDFDNDIPF